MIWKWLIILFAVWSCSSENSTDNNDDGQLLVNDFLVDSLATAETVALYNHLKSISGQGVLFGHQDDLAYGVGWWADAGRSDIKEVCGDYPAVYGWDLGDIQNEQNLDGVNFVMMRQWILQTYQRGGITTVSMHLDNPVTGGNAWDNTKAVAQILPGKVRHQNYLQTLGQIADFLASLKTTDGIYIPVIFRPYHEHNQTWSWWGKAACTAEEYSALWKMTVEYLRDTRSLHHLLYAISPQDISGEADYLERYPGDEWVDILGMDYYKLYNTANITNLGQSLDIVAKLASLKNKVCALTEVGLENVTIADWWTHYLLTAIQYNVNSRKTAWVLTWRNASESHHFAPYPGHSSTPDFIIFYNSPFTIFENDLPDMYH